MAETLTTPLTATEARLSRSVKINWELVGWVLIVMLVLATRLWHLGVRAMSHDESLHTFYSWKLFMGQGYQHDPMMHGPLLYHVTALFYFLFGVSDFTARLLGVVSGVALVVSPVLLRKWLGPVGALATGLMLLVSPTIMYYSRYIRHDIPVELFTVLMFISFFRYVDSREGRWIVLAMAAAGGAVTSAEMAYINGFVLVAFIVVALIVERMTSERAGAISVTLGALGLGLLIFATLASATAKVDATSTGAWSSFLLGLKGFLGDVSKQKSGVRIAMQMSFVFGGIAVIYSLVIGLIGRFHSKPSSDEQAMETERAQLVDYLPQVLLPRMADGGMPYVLLGLGAAVAGIGAILLRPFWMGDGAAVPSSNFFGLGTVAVAAGALLLIVGLGALLFKAIGRGTYFALMVLGVAILAAGGLWAVDLVSKGATAPGASDAQAMLNGALGLAMFGGLVAGWGLLGWALEEHDERRLASALATAPAGAIGAGVGVFLVIYVLLFTTFFQNPGGLMGFFASIRYWLAQQDVQRGGQPWYYYGFLVPMYEFLPFFLSLGAILVYTLRPGLRVGRGNDEGTDDNPTPAARNFVPMLIAWGAANFWIYSWAGEKMPWLTVHLVVPMTFLGGRLIADLLGAVDWQEMRSRGWQLVGLLVLLAVAAGAWLSRLPLAGDTARMSGWIIGLPVILLIGWALWHVARSMGRHQARLGVALAVASLLFVLNVRYSFLANFVNDQLATEYIVYAHGTPDDKLVYNTLRDMQERLGVSTNERLSVAFDNEVSWPFTWYFRSTDWYKADYVADNPSSISNQDVVLVGDPNYSKFDPYLRNRYVYAEYRRMWWPNEGYKDMTLNKIVSALTNPKLRRNWIDIVLYRQYTQDPTSDDPKPKPLSDWYHHANMRMYVRKDILSQVWPLIEAQPEWVTTLGQAPETGVEPVDLQVDQRYQDADGKPIVAPKDIAVGADGALYVLDQENHRIVVFDEDGTFRQTIGDGELVAGDGSASAWGLAVDGDTVYVADTWNHQIVKYVDGQRKTRWGTYGEHKSEPKNALDEMYGPRDVAVGPDGNLYVTDTGNSRVLEFSPDGEALNSFGGDGAESGQFREPVGITYDPVSESFFVVDLWNSRVQRFDKNFQPASEWFVPELDENQNASDKAYIAAGPGSTVAVSDPVGQRVFVYDADGKALATLDVLKDETGLAKPIGVAIDAQGRVYVAATDTGLVTRFAAPQALLDAAGLSSEAAPAGDNGGAQGAEEQGGASDAGGAGASGADSGEAAAPSPTATAQEPAGGGDGGVGPVNPAPTQGASPTAEDAKGAPPPPGGGG